MGSAPRQSHKRPRVTAIQAGSRNGRHHGVWLGNLRVMITKDGASWSAQGLEVDFFVQGTSLRDVKRRFEDGFSATLSDYLREFGSIERFLRPAPREVWRAFARIAAQPFVFSKLAVHRSKVAVAEYRQDIAYFQPTPAAA